MLPPSHRARRVVLAVCAVMVGGFAAARDQGRMAPAPGAVRRPTAVRVQWGGGQPCAWSGTIAVVGPDGVAIREPEWRTLCTEPDAAAMVHADAGALVVHQPRAVATDGVEVVVPDVRGWRVVGTIGAAGGPATEKIDIAVADLFVQESVRPLDTAGNRLVVRLAPGEHLRASMGTSDGRGDAATCRPGERLSITIDPFLPARAEGTGGVELRLRLLAESDGAELDAQTATLVPLPVTDADSVAPGRRPVRFEPVRFDVVLPPREGAWRVEFEAVEGSGLGWARPVASRSLELVTMAAQRAAAAAAEWRVIYELDPGSPRLHERLRRLPGVGLPHVPLPQVPLPSLTRPALPRLPLPSVPLPSVPLPHVPLPQMSQLSALVPRLSGLLAAGHSQVESHPSGPVLRLPPAESPESPAWEGIVVAGAQPDTPHVVEIEFPPDQDARLGVTVLELDRTGSRVESRYAGGFEVNGQGVAEASRPEVHRFVFWPATRHPLVLLSNQSQSKPALVGHVRILAGPGRLPVAAAGQGRRVHAFLPDPAFADFGAADGLAARVAAVVRCAEVLAAQGAAGAMLAVHAGGAALWPSRCTREAPRWGSGADDDGRQAAATDLLAVARRAFEREGLELVPALSFDAPLAPLEAVLARGGTAATGIACIGRDGRARRIGPLAVTHYNILDPRVQAAVEAVVREVAGRLRGSGAVGGVALLLSHDGWLHLPGEAWGLDDATFARFVAAAGVPEPAAGDDRFAARAALVEGPLHDRWLEWRAAEVARFHARLADVLAEHDDRWSLYVAPTTLWAEGALADRLRPTLEQTPDPLATLRDAGLDPVRSTAHRRVVFVAPHVHGDAGLAERSVLATGNALAARAATAAARRGALIVERAWPLDVRNVVPHGPFGSAQAAGACRVRVPGAGRESGRPLVEACAGADLETVFDMRLALTLPATRPPDRGALEALPAEPLTPVAGAPVPLVVRTRRGSTTWVHVVNPGGAAVRATLAITGSSPPALDAVSGAALETHAGALVVDLPAWGMRALRVGADVAVTGARLDYEPGLAATVKARVAGLAARGAALERPVPLEVLDNPDFELGNALDVQRPTAGITGWELVEARRGALTAVAGRGGNGRAAGFSSANGLSTLRSNPFAPPASGRVSVAAWLRIRPGDPQPPLRIALEGLRDEREYYRFAAVGGLAGGRPLAGEWSQFVLQVDDLPEVGLESLRVRFDLLGPGSVEIDDVRVFDLAFTEAERVRLTRQISALQAAAEAGDVGACVVALDGHWPRFLEAHVPVPPAPAPQAVAEPAATKPAERTGVLDRVWRWWQ